MAPRLNSTLTFTLFLAIAGGVFALLIGKHYEISLRDLDRTRHATQNALAITAAHAGLFAPCGDDQTISVFSPTVFVCNDRTATGTYGDIYEHYPARADGRSVMYAFLTEGDRAIADDMLENTFSIQRYDPVTLANPLTWREDPYGERYWRFLFYSLRPLRHLLAAADETGDPRYYAKTRELIASFLEDGVSSPYAWDDPHGAAFRTMVLAYAWWELREAGELPSDLSTHILTALEQHSAFLLDPENYEEGHNHAVTQAAALLIVGVNFPELSGAALWRQTAATRLDESLTGIVDPDGVLTENSPYYHFYVLEKYWEIYQYAHEQDIAISERFDDTIEKMVTFATYVLTPDVGVPLLGASSPRYLVRSGVYEPIAEMDPHLNFVLTRGDEGETPPARAVLYPSSGIALIRSGWGETRPYADETHVLFDTGPYRTDHSDLDALTFTLYSDGATLIRDAGLFTYEKNHPFYRYFFGTRGHNTVVVDGSDQLPGAATQAAIETAGDATWLPAVSELYPGVRHSRTLLLLGHDTLLIFDDLAGGTAHTYEQLFHLPVGAQIAGESDERQLRASISRDGAAPLPLTLTQLIPSQSLSQWEGATDPIRGFCARGYEQRIPCPEVAFTNVGQTARYVTLFQYGDSVSVPEVTYDDARGTVTLAGAEVTYTVTPTYPEANQSPFITLDVASETHEPASPIEVARAFLRSLFEE